MKYKNKSLSVAVSVLVFLVGFADSQAKDPHVFKLPEQHRLIFVTLQPESEVQFKNIEVLARKGQKIPLLIWTLTNNSSKAVRRIQVDFIQRTNVPGWLARGGAHGYDFGTDFANDIILPNSDYTTRSNHSEGPIPPEILRDFEPDPETGEIRYIVVYARIKKVFFADGTIYDHRKEWYPENR